MPMNPIFHQFTPKELYTHVLKLQASDAETAANNRYSIDGKPLCEMLIIFAENVYKYGMKSNTFHADLLHIENISLSHTLLVLTGRKYARFMREFLTLMLHDLFDGREEKLKALSQRMGFAEYSGFYRFVKRNFKQRPGRI